MSCGYFHISLQVAGRPVCAQIVKLLCSPEDALAGEIEIINYEWYSSYIKKTYFQKLLVKLDKVVKFSILLKCVTS